MARGQLNTWYKKLLTFAALLSLLSGLPGTIRADIDGYYKSFVVGYRPPKTSNPLSPMETTPLGSVSNRLRLTAHQTISKTVQFSAAYDLIALVQDPLLFAELPGGLSAELFNYRFDDLDGRLYPSPDNKVASLAIVQNLDRAFVTVRADFADIYAGRQAIGFGSARVINPTDVVAPFSYETLDTEDRVGVDAVRVRIPLGFMGEVDAGYLFGDNFEIERSAMFLRARVYAARTDLSMLLLRFRQNMLVGFDLARSIGGAGVWAEAAHVFVDAFADSSRDYRDYFRGSIGADYAFGEKTYGYVEYHFNQVGRDRTDEYVPNMFHPAFTEGAVYLVGRHYLAPGVSYQLTPLLTTGVNLLANLSDGSAFFSPTVEYNVAENVYLAGGAVIGIGEGPQSVLKYRTEFGSYPDVVYTSFRVYF